MGLPILVAVTKKVSNQFPDAFGGYGLAVVLCAEDFLNVLAATPTVLASFRSLLLTLMTFIDLAVAAIELLVSQLDIITTVANDLIQPYLALRAQMASELNQFGFGAFPDCPLIQDVKSVIMSQVPSNPLMSKIRNIEGYIAQTQYELLQWQKQVAALNAQIEKLKVSKLLFQALIDAIDAQWPGI